MTDPRTLAVLADLAVVGDRLDALVSDLPEEAWRTPTPAEGWDVATTVGHLAWTDEVAVAAAAATEGEQAKTAWDEVVLGAMADPDGFVDAEAARLGALAPEDLLARWREGRQRLARALSDLPAGAKMPWFGPPMGAASMATARLMETWAHGLDVAEGLAAAGVSETADAVEPDDLVRHVVHLGVRTRRFAFANRGLPAPEAPVRVRLTAPSGEEWLLADPPGAAETAEQEVTGPAWDFALLVTQRRHRDDLALVAHGPDAEAWLDVAQAFAGPPGPGRTPAGGSR